MYSKRYQRFSYILMALIASLCGSSTCFAEIVFKEPQKQLGKIQSSGEVTHRFEFEVKSVPAEIVEVRPSCGCVSSSFRKRKFQPGETGVIPISVHTAGQTPGDHRFQLSMTVRDPQERKVVLSAEMTLVREINVRPANLRVVMDGSKKVTQSIKIEDPRTTKLNIKEIDTSDARISASVPGKADRNTQVVLLAFEDSFPEGATSTLVTIRTDDPVYKTITLPVTVVRPSRVQTSSKALRLSKSDLGKEKVQRVFLVRDRLGKPVQVESVVANASAIECEVKSGQRYVRVTVEIDPQKVSDSNEMSVTVNVSKPIVATLDIPVLIR